MTIFSIRNAFYASQAKRSLLAASLILSLGLISEQSYAKDYPLDSSFYRDGKTAGGRYWVTGDSGDWYMTLGDKDRSAGGKIRVSGTKDVNGNPAKVFEWKKKGGDGYVALADYSTQSDLTPYKDAAALAVDVKVMKKPDAGFEFSMKGDKGANAAVYIQESLKGMKQNKWYTLLVPLSCMVAKGADLSKSVHLMQLRTGGRAKLGVANVRLERIDDSMKNCKELVAFKLEK